MLQVTVSKDRDVMSRFGFAAPYVFRCKQFLPCRFLRDVIADHIVETHQLADLAKVDLLLSTHAHKKCGLFENVEMNMERAVALKKLGKLLGKSLGYRVDPKAPDADEREEARTALKIMGAERDDLKSKMDARRQAILEGDAEYQSLRAAWTTAKDRADKLSWRTHHYRFTAGVMNSMFFMVKAQGDSWEEVIAKIEKERQAA